MSHAVSVPRVVLGGVLACLGAVGLAGLASCDPTRGQPPRVARVAPVSAASRGTPRPAPVSRHGLERCTTRDVRQTVMATRLCNKAWRLRTGFCSVFTPDVCRRAIPPAAEPARERLCHCLGELQGAGSGPGSLVTGRAVDLRRLPRLLRFLVVSTPSHGRAVVTLAPPAAREGRCVAALRRCFGKVGVSYPPFDLRSDLITLRCDTSRGPDGRRCHSEAGLAILSYPFRVRLR